MENKNTEPNIQPTTQTSPTSQVETPQPKSYKGLIAFLLVLVLVLASSTAYFAYKSMQTSNQRNNLPTQTSNPQSKKKLPTSPTPTIPQAKIGSLTPIDNNQDLYKNETYQFEMNLPNNFYITQEGYWENENDSTPTYYTDLSTIKPEEVPGRQFAGIRIIVRNFSGDLYQYVDNIKTGFDEYDPNNPEAAITETYIDGVSAYKVFNDIYVYRNGYLYSINNGVDETIFNQILSTFKFI